MYGSNPEDVFYYLTLYNENYPMPAMPDRPGVEEGIIRGLYRWAAAPEGPSKRATILFSGSAQGAARQAAAELAEHYDVGAELWSATSYKALREEALEVERWNRLHPGQAARTPSSPGCSTGPQGPIVAVTDFMKVVPDQVSRFVAGRRSSRSAPTASAAPTPGRPCAATSRSTPPTSSWPCSRAWPRWAR